MSKSADAFRTISEVADWLGVQTHVLRFWESKFTQIKPVKRAGGRRYYRPADMLLLGGIRKLLHEDGLTIKGVQKILREEGMAHVADMSGPLDDETAAQIDGDLIAESGFIEAELAPATASEETVTPFPPVQTPPPEGPQPTAPISYNLPDLEPDPEPEPEPEPEPDIVVAPDPEPTPVEDAPEPNLFASDEATAPPDAPAPEPMFSEPPIGDAALDSSEQEQDSPAADPAFSPLPSFLAEPAPEAQQEPEPDHPVSLDAEPMTDAVDDKAAPQAADIPTEPAPVPVDDLPPAIADTHSPDTPAQTADLPDGLPAPRTPRIVDVPADPDPATLEVSPSVLSKLAHVKRLTPEQRSAMRPLLAQLTALRDHMASVRRDPR
jgi:DNA-binding transcriptional MerR regulator